MDSLNKQRDETIEKLKVATKYNSTQQLLDKYGGDSPSPDKAKTGAAKNPKRKDAAQQQQQQQLQSKTAFASGRTGLPPPPTANIRRQSLDVPAQIPPNNNNNYLAGKPLPPPPSGSGYTEQASFAPNAFPPSQAQYDKTGGIGAGGPKWYDRLMDVLLGEDEASPKNRVVLICQNCRLVNGQAPPGVKSLEDLGRWRCGGCGAWNGEESEAKKVLDSIQQSSRAETVHEDREEVVAKSEHGDEEEQDESESDASLDKEDETIDDTPEEKDAADKDTSSGVSTRTRSKRAKK